MFAVAIEKPTRGDKAKFRYMSAIEAERAARRIVNGRGGEMSIWYASTMSRWPECIAIVLKDALGRVWTEVTASPGQTAFL